MYFDLGGVFLAAFYSKELARRYAKALFNLTLDENCMEAISSDLKDLGTMLTEIEDLNNIVLHPVLSISEQKSVMATILDKAGMHTLIKNFVALIIDNHRLFILQDAIREFFEMLFEYRKENKVLVVSAAELPSAQYTRLKETLEETLKSDVTIETEIDNTLIGGFKLFVNENYMVDCSVATRLDNLHNSMKGKI